VLPCSTGTPASPRHPGLYLHHFHPVVYADICWKEVEEKEEEDDVSSDDGYKIWFQTRPDAYPMLLLVTM